MNKNFLKRQHELKKILKKLKKQTREKDYKLILGDGDDLSEFMNSLVNKKFVNSDDALKINKQIISEFNSKIVNRNSLVYRVNYLIEGVDLSKDKELFHKNLSKPQYLCPHCYQPIPLTNPYCKTCGHALALGEYLGADKILDELYDSDANVFDLREDELNEFLDEYNDEHLKFDLDDNKQTKELIEMYKSNDNDAFQEFREKYNFPYENLKDLENICFDNPLTFADGEINYIKNICTSRKLLDLDKPVKKHTLTGYTEYSLDQHPNSLTYHLHKVLTDLGENPNLKEVCDNIGLKEKQLVVPLILFRDNMIKNVEYGDEIYKQFYDQFTVKELKEILKRHELKLSGNKDDLIIILLENNLFYEFGANKFILTEKGEKTNEKMKWIDIFSTYLEFFDFDDFMDFIKHKEKLHFKDEIPKYLDEHLKIAHKNKDFPRLHDVYSSRVCCKLEWGKIEQGLNDEITLFIIKLNPIYLDKKDLESYTPIDHANISNIFELIEYCNINDTDLKELFYKCWSELDLEKTFMPKEVALNYMTLSIINGNLEEISNEIKDTYY